VVEIVTVSAGLALLMTALCTGYQEGQAFPELEPRGGGPAEFKWQYENGPDFYVFYATTPSDPRSYAGIYFGLHPKFTPPATKATETTSVLGKSVVWYDTGTATQKFRREAIVDYRHSARHLELKLHIWLVAASREKLTEMMHALSHLKLEEVPRPIKPPGC
jgi:hypothetical protein